MIIKHFRQAVLAAACSGRLTADWREKNVNIESGKRLLKRIGETKEGRHRTKLGNPKGDKKEIESRPLIEDVLSDFGLDEEIPETWAWTTVGEAVNLVTDGVHKTPKYMKSGVPFISVNNLDDNGRIIFDGCKYISRQDHEALIKRCKPKKFDILFGKVGTLGRTAIINDDIEFSIFVNLSLVKTLLELTNPYFLAFTLRNGYLSGEFNHAIGGTAQQYIGIGAISSLPIRFPPLEEQHEIVRRVEALFKLGDIIEKRVALATSRTEKMTQAILAKAFRGELVPTEAELARRERRSYESASELLARIKSESKSKGEPKLIPRNQNRQKTKQVRLAK
jgi:type I restriction enzyme S subunit